MNNFQSMALICVSAYLISFQAQAAEQPIPQCPAKIRVKQDADSRIENGWKAADSKHAGEYRLQHVGFSAWEYPAVQSGFLIPSEERKLKRGAVQVFYDYLTVAANEAHDYWAVCTYRDTSIVLVRKIPETIARCEVNYPNDPPATVTFRCFDTPRANAK